MYDYISIRKDTNYSVSVPVKTIAKIAAAISDTEKVGNVSYAINLGEFRLLIKGILASPEGNYSYNSDEEFDEVNLVEIEIPQGSENIYEEQILRVAKIFAENLGWEIKE